MAAVQTRPDVQLTASFGSDVQVTASLDDLVADAREVGVALAAMRAHWLSRNGSVRIPAQAVRLVSDLGTYGA